MTGPQHASPEVEWAAPQQTPAEPTLGAIAPVPLMVGHAEDRAERDADTMADTALGRLRRLEGDTHSHGPGCDHSQVRRSAAPPNGAPVIGYEGGALDPGTSDAIESRRGSGRALDAGVRRRMETAFNTSFSAVRIHDDAKAANLNSAVSATAFTTGKDIFFGSKQYAPGTPGGDRVLAHELAHTLQPEGGAHRTVSPTAGIAPHARAAVVRSVTKSVAVHRWFWDKKKPVGPEAAPVGPAEPTVAAKPYADNIGGKLPSNLEERGKAGVVAGVVGGAKVAGMATAGAGMAGNVLGGAVGGAAGLLTTVDSLTGLNNARKMGKDAKEFGDEGMGNLSDRKYKNQGIAAIGGAATTAKGGVEMAYLAGAGTNGLKAAVTSGVGNATLGAAAGGLGVATGSIQVLQGLWKGGKAVQKLARLKWGRAKKMYSQKGKAWKDLIMGSEQFKLGMAGIKTALGILGIAAGALLIVSNPIGWGIGIAAAIAGGVYAGVKIAAKIKDARARTAIAESIRGAKDPVDAANPDGPAPAPSKDQASKKAISDRSDAATARAGAKKAGGPAPISDREKSRLEAIEKANEVARRASQYAVAADEMRTALRSEEQMAQIGEALQEEERNAKQLAEMRLRDQQSLEMMDAFMLLSSINVGRDEALSDSGQELIEKKLSKMESM